MSKSNLAVTLLVTVIIAGAAYGQRPVPSLTTDDIVSPSTSPASGSPTKAGEAEKGTAGSSSSPAKDKQAAQKPQAKNAEAAITETEWNAKVKQAQERTAELDRRADQGELEINDLRNFLKSAKERTPEANQQVLEQINKIADAVRQLKAASASAREDLTHLMKDGGEAGFKVSEKPLVDSSGKPDLSAIQEESEKARQEIKDAQARIDLLQVQLNGVQAGIYKAQTADNFALGKLRQDRERISDDIERNRLKIAELNSKLNDMQQKAQPAKPDGK